MAGLWSEPTHTGGEGVTVVVLPEGAQRWEDLQNQEQRTCQEMGFACRWIWPWGFVPETGCPIHDD